MGKINQNTNLEVPSIRLVFLISYTNHLLIQLRYLLFNIPMDKYDSISVGMEWLHARVRYLIAM